MNRIKYEQYHGAAGYDAVARRKIKELEKTGGGGGRLETTETLVYDRHVDKFFESGGGWQKNMYPMTGDDYFVLENKTYIVEFDGEKYTPKTIVPGYIYVGNASLLNSEMEDTGEPFVLRRDGTEFTIFTTLSGESHDIRLTTVDTNLVFDGNGGITNVVHVDSDGNRFLGSVAMGDVYPCTNEMIAAMIDRFGYVNVQEPIPADSGEGFESGIRISSYFGYGKFPDGTILLFD